MPQQSITFSAGSLGANLQTGSPVCEIYTSATDSPVVTEISIYVVNPSTVGNLVFGLGAPAVQGSSRNSLSSSFVSHNPNDAVSSVSCAVDWGSPPTVPAKFFRRVILSGTTAAAYMMVLKLPLGIKLIPSSSLVIWCISGMVSPSNNASAIINIEIDS